MNAKECDRCHKFYKTNEKYPKYKLTKVNKSVASRYSKSLDLCPSCQDSLAKWYVEENEK